MTARWVRITSGLVFRRGGRRLFMSFTGLNPFEEPEAGRYRLMWLVPLVDSGRQSS